MIGSGSLSTSERELYAGRWVSAGDGCVHRGKFSPSLEVPGAFLGVKATAQGPQDPSRPP